MNTISLQELLQIEDMALNRGWWIRKIERETGIHRDTVRKYYPREAVCKCGRSALHRSWCKERQRICEETGETGAWPAALEGLKKGRKTQKRDREVRREMRQAALERGLIWKKGKWVPRHGA